MAEDKAIKKTQAISNAQRNMLIVVAAASVVTGFALVGSIFLFQQLAFNQQVIDAKTTTKNTLVKNNQNINSLRAKLQTLGTSTALRSVMVATDGNALRVIGDSLPMAREGGANLSALGASVRWLLESGTGVRVNSLAFDESVSGPAGSAPAATVDPITGLPVTTSPGAPTENFGTVGSVGVRFEVEGSPNAVSQALQNIEASIRQIDIVTMNIEFSGTGNLRMTISAVAYYLDPPTVTLGTRSIN